MEECTKDAGEILANSHSFSKASRFLTESMNSCKSCILFSFSSNDSWYGVGAYYSGIIMTDNTTENINPSPDIYYILNFDDICRSYGKSS